MSDSIPLYSITLEGSLPTHTRTHTSVLRVLGSAHQEVLRLRFRFFFISVCSIQFLDLGLGFFVDRKTQFNLGLRVRI